MEDGQKMKARSERPRQNYAVVAANFSGCSASHGGEAAEKKECLFLTNKANMLLKTKDRQNEQSQTKPILEDCGEADFAGTEGGGVNPPLRLGTGQKAGDGFDYFLSGGAVTKRIAAPRELAVTAAVIEQPGDGAYDRFG